MSTNSRNKQREYTLMILNEETEEWERECSLYAQNKAEAEGKAKRSVSSEYKWKVIVA